jgi:lipopolysaccharide cholinephosphotransferase
MNQYVYDEINAIKDLMMPTRARIRTHSVCDEYIVLVNTSPVSKYFACASMLLAKSVDSVKTHIVYCDDECKNFINEFLESACPNKDENPQGFESFYERIKIYKSTDDLIACNRKFTYKKIRFCSFLDSEATCYNDDEVKSHYLEELDKMMIYASRFDTSKVVHISQIPRIKALPSPMTSISEREYEVYATQFDHNSAEHFVLKCEEIIRTYAKQGLNAVSCRLDNVFGPGIDNEQFDKIIDDLTTLNTINADTATINKYFGMNYIRFAGVLVFFCFVHGKRGNIYNAQQYLTTPYDFAIKTYDYFSDYKTRLCCVNSTQTDPQYALLCSKKIDAVMLHKYCDMELGDCIYRTVLSKLDFEYFDKKYIFHYDGKLDEIKKLELEMMEEVKRICEKHNIKYFLVGGSLLGAIRHKGFIPWDDDLDFGMLREDYEKFRKVAPDELNPKYSYQSYKTEPNSHYIFDKIRLKDTFFTTKFSDMFEIENGLFIDILIYDKTAKSPKMQKLHTDTLRRWIRLMNIRWVNKPRKNVAYKFSKFALPIMRLFPMKLYHKIFNLMLKWYSHSSSKWAIDGVGQNIERGAFPIEWLEDTIDVEFEDTTFPIPKGYDEYLRHWYGNNYMQLLPISTRNSGHVLKRIDLGSYATRFGFDNGKFHHASKAGELFDYYDEEIR